jgi:hypothetical protein
MKTRIIVEDVQFDLNPRRYYAEAEVCSGVVVRVAGDSVADAAYKVLRTLRSVADFAERKFIESGVVVAPVSGPTVLDDVREQARNVLARVRADVPSFAGNLPLSVQQALNLLAAVADGMMRTE